MKKHINMLIVLTLFGTFKVCLSMEERSVETKRIKTSNGMTPRKTFHKKMPTLLQIAAMSHAKAITKEYQELNFSGIDEHLIEMAQFIDHEPISEPIIYAVCYDMVRHGRGDIFVKMSFAFYENSQETDKDKKILKSIQFFKNAPEEIQHLVVDDYGKALYDPSNGTKIFKKFMFDFIKYIDDIEWIEKLNIYIQYCVSVSARLNNVIHDRICLAVENFSRLESEKIKKDKKIDIPKELVEYADSLVNKSLDKTLTLEEKKCELNIILNDLPNEKRRVIFEYIIINYFDRFGNFYGEDEDETVDTNTAIFFMLVDCLFQDEIKKAEQLGSVLAILMEHYPETVKRMSFGFDAPLEVEGSSELIWTIDEAVHLSMKNSLLDLMISSELQDEEKIDQIMSKIDKNFDRFGFRFVADIFHSILLDLLNRRQSNLTVIASLEKIRRRLLSNDDQRYNKIGYAISESFGIITKQAEMRKIISQNHPYFLSYESIGKSESDIAKIFSRIDYWNLYGEEAFF